MEISKDLTKLLTLLTKLEWEFSNRNGDLMRIFMRLIKYELK
jgi:hypothetical protein